MSDEFTVARRRVRILNALGLHLRAANKVAREGQSYRVEVWVTHDGATVDGKSILGLMTLAAGCGATIDIEVRGPEAARAAAALADLVAARFHEAGGDEGA